MWLARGWAWFLECSACTRTTSAFYTPPRPPSHTHTNARSQPLLLGRHSRTLNISLQSVELPFNSMSLHTHTHTHKHTLSLVEMTGSGFSQAAGGQRSCWAWVSCFHAVAAGSQTALPSEVGWNNDWDLLPHIHGGQCVCFAHPLKCRLLIVSLHCAINCFYRMGIFGVVLSYFYGILKMIKDLI